ncbi:DgyrCDS3225 [Dimorphilus gyrociliatus]|uniref:DgyrCDS3225 n=1 Tax=Dimorphilus gyrociliatus TaxID=2664684 RepID=A0A7I8VDQ1_9ANNE|nr:DgyrCDS3225 [Dimorphilus gyrociliatus]
MKLCSVLISFLAVLNEPERGFCTYTLEVLGSPEVPEGSSFQVKLSSSVEGACVTKDYELDASDIEITKTSLVLPVNSEKATYIGKFYVLSDLTEEEDEVHKITFTCYFETSITTATATVTILDGEEEDPRFMQVVQDQRDLVPKKICYDIKSENYNQLAIYHDLEKNITITGTLLDDYYLHEIDLLSFNSHVFTTTNDITFNGMKTIEWSDCKQRFNWYDTNFNIDCQDDTLHVWSLRKSNINSSSFRIKRSQNVNIGYYLDISIDNLLNYQKISGIIGRIGKNEFKFFQSTQEDKEKKIGSIEVNGRLFPVRFSKRYSQKCWLLNVNDLLFPYKLDSYLSQK